MKTRALALLAFSAALAGCGDDIIAVKGKIADPAPQVGTFHTVFIIHAYDIASLGQVQTTPNGDFTINYSDGSRFSGNVNRSIGIFTVKLTQPGAFTFEIDDTGHLDFDGQGNVTHANYIERRRHTDGSEASWNTDFVAGSTTLSLDAREHGGTHVVSLGTDSSSKLRVDETWSLASIFQEQVSTTYNFSGGVQQNWTRDDIATAVNPDRTANFNLAADGSGSGSLVWNYDHGISQTYQITLAADGSYDSVITYEDPGTTVSPDGQGTFHVDATYVGSGTYVEKYDDGSRLDIAEMYEIDGSTRDDFTFDDASTAFTPDLEGGNVYFYDGSGNGFWKTHNAVGIAETCTYDFDAAGTISNISCSGIAAASAPVSAPAQRFPRVIPIARN